MTAIILKSTWRIPGAFAQAVRITLVKNNQTRGQVARLLVAVIVDGLIETRLRF